MIIINNACKSIIRWVHCEYERLILSILCNLILRNNPILSIPRILFVRAFEQNLGSVEVNELDPRMQIRKVKVRWRVCVAHSS